MSADQAESPERRLVALEAELEALKDEVRSVRAVQTQLIRDSALAQRDPSDRLQTLGTAVEALADRVEALERRIDEASADDPLAALSGRRDAGAQRLADDVAMLKQARDDAVCEFSLLRQGWKVLDKRLRKIEEQQPVAAPVPAQSPSPAPPPRLSVTQPARTPSRVVLPPTRGAAVPPPAAQPARVPAPAPTPPPAPQHAPPAEALTVIHVEEHAPFQHAVRATLGKWMMHYAAIDEPAPSGRSLLMINLLLAGADPLALLQRGRQPGVAGRVAFAYCADAARGVAFGLTEFFPAPFDPAGCADRVSQRSERVQRLLVVTDKVEGATALKNLLGASGCTTSMAFDGRQAVDLVRMVRPDLVLVDLGLPKGQGVQTAVRLGVDPKYPRLQLAFFWDTPIAPAEFCLDAQRAIRDFPFSADDLARAVTRFLSPAVSGAFPILDRL